MIAAFRKGLTLFVMAAVLAAGLVLFVSPGPVAAAGLGQESQPSNEEIKTPDPARLEQAYQRQLKLLEAQADRLEHMGERSADFAKRIAGLKEEGKDVSALEDALEEYNESLAEAQSMHAEAAEIMAEHAGFDANGKVTDVQLAAETLKDAGRTMKDIQQELRDLPRLLRQALREFRRDNRP